MSDENNDTWIAIVNNKTGEMTPPVPIPVGMPAFTYDEGTGKLLKLDDPSTEIRFYYEPKGLDKAIEALEYSLKKQAQQDAILANKE